MAVSAREVTLDDVQELLGRALVDSDFRTQLLKDPAGTFVVLGYKMSDESKAFFAALNDQTFLAAANTVENRLGGRPVVAAWF